MTDHCSQTRAARGFTILTVLFFVIVIPIERIAARETLLVRITRHDYQMHQADVM